MAQNLDLNINVNTDQAGKSVGSLKSQLREAQAEVAALADKFGATSKEAIEAAKRAGELKDRIGDAKALTEAFNPDAKFKSLTSSLAGVAGGFAAVQGAMALFGSESEDLQKTLVKVQSAMALSQGLQAVGESIDSFKQLGAVIKTQVIGAFSTLRGAIIATGVGALAIGLGLVIANFDKVKETLTNIFPGFIEFANKIKNIVQGITDFVGVTSKAARAQDNLKSALETSNKSIDNQIKILEAQGGQEDEIYKQKRERINNQIKLIKGSTQQEKQARADLSADLKVLEINEANRIKKANEDASKNRKEARADRADKEKQAAKEREAAELDAAKKIINLKNDVEVLGIKDEFEAKKKAIENALAAEIEDVKKNENLKSETKNALIKALNEKADAEIKVALNQQLDEQAKIIKENNKKLLEDQRELNVIELQDKIQLIDRENELLENDFEADQIRTENKREYLKKQKEIELSDLDLSQSERFVIIAKYANLERDLDKQIADSKKQQREEELKADQELQEAKYQIAQAGLGLLSSLAGDNEKLANIIFAISKALEIGRIISTTAGAIAQINANTASIPAILPPSLPNPAFVTAVAIGAKKIAALKIGAGASIATIAAASIAKFKSGGGSGGAIQGGSAATAQAPIIPQLPAAQTTNISRQSINDLGNQAVRAYVIETDVTGNQQRMAAIRQRARFS